MAAENTFANLSSTQSSPAVNADGVTPSDVAELDYVTRGLYVGGTGDVTVVMQGGQTVTFTGAVAGSVLPIRAKQVLDTGTDATGLVALW